MTVPDVYLDAQIRNWVLVPISLTMFVVGVLRHFVNKVDLLQNSPAIGVICCK
jgi:hypothetical protein